MAGCQKAVVNVTPNQVKPGGKVTITVKGWVANASAEVQAALQNGVSDVITAKSDALPYLIRPPTKRAAHYRQKEMSEESSKSYSTRTAYDVFRNWIVPVWGSRSLFRRADCCGRGLAAYLAFGEWQQSENQESHVHAVQSRDAL